MHGPPSKIVLPTVETCRWRRPPAGDAPAACGLAASLLDEAPEGLFAASDAACAVCCRSFPPTRRMPNPVVAGLLHAVASRLLRDGGTADCGVEAAARAASFAGRWLDLRLPDAFRVTPARGTLPCAWRGAPESGGGPGEPTFACEHADHDVALPSTCRLCPDWARHRPISRRMTVEELVPPPAVRSGGPVRDWAVAVTTAPRRQETLEACLDGVLRAGWDAPRLFLDGTARIPPRYAHLPTTWREEGVGAWPAWYLALAELVLRRPGADAYLMLQDDVALLDRGPLRAYLERALWPGERPGVVSLFYTGDRTTPGWHLRGGDWPWGAQAFVFPPGLARAFLADAGVIRALLNASPDHHTPIPTVLYEWAWRNRVDFWYATPSLAQHIGNASAIWEGGAALTGGRRAPWFAGGIDEAFALEEGLADFPESAFACEPALRDAYGLRVGRGRDRMAGLSAVFCGVCHDVRHFLPRLAARVEKLGGLFRDYRVVLVAGESTDATAEYLADWRAADPRVEVLAAPPGPSREGGRMARWRNLYRDRVAAAYPDFDHALVVDADAAGGWSYDGVAHTFGAGGWDFVGSSGLARAPAVAGEGPRYRRHDPRSTVAGAGAPEGPARGGPLVPVESCFGGLGIYRMACLRAASYGGDDGREHDEFHARLRRAGLGRLFLNPSQIVLHSPA